LRVGIFTDSYRPYTSGVVRSIETFRLALAARGVSFFIFAPRYPNCEPEEKVFRFFSLPAPTNPDFAVAIPLSVRLGRTLKSLGLDLIHVHSPFFLGGLGARWARRLELPLVFTYHTLYEEYVHYFPFLRQLARAVTRRYTVNFCNRCDLVLAPTGAIREYLLRSGVSVPVAVLPTGIELAAFQGGDGAGFRKRLGIDPGEKVLLYVGRLGKEKNIAFLLRAFRDIAARLDAVRLVLVGGGPAREELYGEARRLGIHGKVVFAGPVPPERVKDCYAAADLFVMASLTETQGLVIGEAKAAGLPVVAVRAQGVSEMVNEGVDGFLTPLDEAAFATVVCRVLGDPHLYRNLKEGAVVKATSLSIGRLAAVLLGHYRALIEKKRGDDFTGEGGEKRWR